MSNKKMVQYSSQSCGKPVLDRKYCEHCEKGEKNEQIRCN